ncbi:hypothetical protein OB955_16510 [Halobacteria archaeon AArc-m2/3/4]|uniref:Halobacterial output domain-containing protein n=1 Tax=Natronoglomus mannanivorans TaxID=2979990 RepID=A0ABT2QHB8_9EURY|nr:hypothetical protein [Halobacteria archaeon AArc-m2/3/4]
MADSESDIDIDADFDRLVENVRTQSSEAPGSDTERVTIRSLEDVSYDGLRELLTALEDEDVDPGRLTFYLSPTNAERLLENADATDFETLEERLGQPLRVEEGMPEDAILFMDPDAVSGSEIADPSAIACGTIGAT